MGDALIHGDALTVLQTLSAESIQCVVTSPPYWGLRDYKIDGQLGLERTPEAYVARLVDLFREVRRVMANNGTLWLNLGDSYAGSAQGWEHDKQYAGPIQSTNYGSLNQPLAESKIGFQRPPGYISSRQQNGLKPKDLVGIPWRVAFALQADGWYLRSDIIWAKPNPMPESVTDRPTKAHEYLFLLTKSKRYYYNADAIAERPAPASFARLGQAIEHQAGLDRANGGRKTNGPMKAVFGGRKKAAGYGTRLHSGRKDDGFYLLNGVNKRSVWTIAAQPYAEAHFATFPEALVEPCILAGSRPGDTVLDPFCGSGTTLAVAKRFNRHYLGIDLNPDYTALAEERLSTISQPLPFDAEGAGAVRYQDAPNPLPVFRSKLEDAAAKRQSGFGDGAKPAPFSGGETGPAAEK